MKVRFGFVSNSSSSSFICSIPATKDSECIADIMFYNDIIRDIDNAPSEYELNIMKEYETYKELAKKERLYIFDIYVDNDCVEHIESILDRIPNLKVIKMIDY